MFITLKIDGGFAFLPGLNRPKDFDTGQMPAEEARVLEGLVRSANFFALPADSGPPPRGAADFRTFEVTVRDGGQSHSVRTFEPVSSPGLDQLIQYLLTSSPGKTC